MEEKLLAALKRAIEALNTPKNFTTAEGIKSYTLIPQLEKVAKEAEAEATKNYTYVLSNIVDGETIGFEREGEDLEGLLEQIGQDYDVGDEDLAAIDDDGTLWIEGGEYRICRRTFDSRPLDAEDLKQIRGLGVANG